MSAAFVRTLPFHSRDEAFHRCRYPKDYALANHVQHPANVYLGEKVVLPLLDDWLLKLFAPHRVEETVRGMLAAQPVAAVVRPVGHDTETAALIAECDTKLGKYRSALEAGVDPDTVREWIREVQAERAAIVARAASRVRSEPQPGLSEAQITYVIGSASKARRALHDATPEDRADVYRQMGLRLTYQPGKQIVRAEISLGPDDAGSMVRVRGGLSP